jgi:hypothetical protein
MKKRIEEIVIEIEKAKDKTRKETGAFKYDFCYDECIDIINQYYLLKSKGRNNNQ